MTILLFFILPFATILLSIVLQKLLKSPILVAITFFAIYLILTYTVFGTSFLIFAIVYSILAYITAAITRLICTIIRRLRECNCDGRWINWLCRDDYTRSNNIANSNNITGISNVSNGNNIISANNVANDNNIIGTTNITETINNNGRNTSCCNNSGNTATQARFTVTSNQANPVLLLTNRTNTQRRNNCNCCRRCN